MSGIAGILRFDSEAIERRDLERAANALRAHGPDRRGILAAGSVGLVHVLMRMVPEDQFDRQPWRAASGAVIGADVRLDNRDDLLVRLGIAPADAMTWADARVVLTAWEKYGNDLWPMLRGPFAIAIWDPRQNVLVLARDQLGLGIAVWHKNEQFFVFATAPKGLFALTEVPRRLSEKKFADFMVLNHADHATTMYEGIYRVPPAHVLSVRADGRMEERRYWSASSIKPVRLTSNEAYAERIARMPRSSGAPTVAQRSSRWLLSKRRTQLFLGRRSRRPCARREKPASRSIHPRPARGFRRSGARGPLR